ncbi:20400_t:CDS:1, partial [Funneliformis geosporum]
MVDNKVIKIHKQWHSILGEEIPLIEPYNYVKLNEIFPPPKLPVTGKNGTVIEVLPYIRQKVKMWGADVLRAENIKTLIEEADDVSDKEFSDVESMDEDQDFLQKNKLSRFDCIASLLASSECTVAQDIFQTLSQFPIAFPLIMPGLVDANNFKVLLPLLIGPVIKWETKPGTIIENHLFSDPFKMIVAVRIGASSPGKSSIINQLMTSDSMFSSSSEPRAEYGIPHMVSGSVEFTWLTQETCGVSLWNEVFKNYYKEGTKEIVLFANLHGDALDYPNQIRFLKQFPSSFLVFLMPGYTDDQVDTFKNIVDTNKIVYCWVNHKKKKKYSIDTTLLTKDQTLKKVRHLFKEALDFTLPFKYNKLTLRDSLHLGETLQFTESIELSESQLLIDFVKQKTCRHIKLQIIQQRKQSDNGHQIWQENDEMHSLIFLFIDILNLPLGKRIRALAHLEREVSMLSMVESSEARNKALLKREELRKTSLDNRNQKSEESIRREIAKIWAEVCNISLGMEHLFRELGRIYFSVHYQSHDTVLKLPQLYAELLISGHTIELLDGDAGAISEAWFSAICNCICKKFPKLRIFVISIL